MLSGSFGSDSGVGGGEWICELRENSERCAGYLCCLFGQPKWRLFQDGELGFSRSLLA